MSRKKVYGICHICGADGPLTFEHVPPQAAFNNEKVRNPKFDDYVHQGPDYIPKHAPIEQRGAGGYTLCSGCNNSTGSWYANEYVSFAIQAAILLNKSQGDLTLQYPYYLHPLQLIKQVIAMFCSVNGNEFSRIQDLRRFLLHKETKYLRPNIRIYAFLTLAQFSRQSGISAAFMNGSVHHFSEIAFAPLGFILTIDSPPPDERLLDITHFASYEYHHFDVFFLKLPVLPISYFLPADFRTREQIMRDYENNIREYGE